MQLDFKQLVQKYLVNGLTAEEERQLAELSKDPVNKALLEELIEHDLQEGVYMETEQELVRRRELGFTRLWTLIDEVPEPRRIGRRYNWIGYAAAVLLVLGTGAYLWFNKHNKPSTVATTQPAPAKNELAPGHDGAVLILANGTKVVLDSMGNGVVAYQNGSTVVLKNGQLAYDLTGSVEDAVVYNTMSTPRGRQFRLTLPDGTKVWLNAASSIQYPTVFNSKERRVKITGEVYFEVAKNVQMPFHVMVNHETEVEVLGTQFNVNAYENEKTVQTTLLEGSVRIKQGKESVMLKPGQQAQVATAIHVVENTSIDKVMAWKNGLFNFQDVPFEEAMRQLERWYDIEVVYEKGVPDNIEFMGEITKGVTLNSLLIVLKKIGVKCTLEGRRLIVTQ